MLDGRIVSAIRPPLATIARGAIRLEPMTREHLPALFRAIGHPEVFAGGYGGGPAGFRATEAAFVEWARTGFDWHAGHVYAVIASGGPLDGVVVGTSTMSDFDLPNESTHIGWTAYDPRVWGGIVNPLVKLLLLGTAFDHGFGRVRIQADARNSRSRAAIERLGATFEGIARRDKRRADGSWRDTAIFSVIVDDWPRVRAALDARIASFGDEPVHYRERPAPPVRGSAG